MARTYKTMKTLKVLEDRNFRSIRKLSTIPERAIKSNLSEDVGIYLSISRKLSAKQLMAICLSCVEGSLRGAGSLLDHSLCGGRRGRTLFDFPMGYIVFEERYVEEPSHKFTGSDHIHVISSLNSLITQVVDDGQRTVRYFNTVCLASPEGKIVAW